MNKKEKDPKDKFDLLDFCVQNNYNVFLNGRHGVGKTTKAIKVFRQHKLNWVYFSASTMDPWVDFIGIPKEKIDGELSYLDLVRPKKFAEDKVEAIFIDEIGRSVKKVRNAVMQLIQFRSINDYEFKNLKMVWAATNPDNDSDLSYDVEQIDPAQVDRFPFQIDLPYELDEEYFTNKYGENIFSAAKEWWGHLPHEIKLKVSPRRVDYGIEIYIKSIPLMDNGVDIVKHIMDYVFPKGSNPRDLISKIEKGSYFQRLKDILRTPSKIEEYMKDFNNLRGSLPYIIKSKKAINETFCYIDNETLTGLLTNNMYASYVMDYILEHPEKYRESIESLMQYSAYAIPKNIMASLHTCYKLNFLR